MKWFRELVYMLIYIKMRCYGGKMYFFCFLNVFFCVCVVYIKFWDEYVK